MDKNELSPSEIEQFYYQISELTEHFKNPNKRSVFFTRFPSESLLNYSIVDKKNWRTCLNLVQFLSNYQEFYSSERCFNDSFDFLLTSLTGITQECYEIGKILKIIAKVLSTTNVILKFNLERFMEILLQVIEIDKFSFSKPSYYFAIASCLKLKGVPDSKSEKLMVLLFEKLKSSNHILEMCQISNEILNWSLSNISCCKDILNWIANLPLIIALNNDSIKIKILELLVNFIETFKHENVMNCNEKDIFEIFYKNLMAVSSEICILSTIVEAKQYCFELLITSYFYFSNKEKLYREEINFYEVFNHLPDNVEDWPNFKNHWMLCIYFMVAKESKFIWKDSYILNLIHCCFYQQNICISLHVLKAIFYLFPELNNELYSNDTYEYDLIRSFDHFSQISCLFTLSTKQFKWIFCKGTISLKTAVLRNWLEQFKDDQTIINIIHSCNCETYLFKVYLENFNHHIGSRAIELILKIDNKEFLKQITRVLPLTINNSKCFNTLLLCKPEVPTNPQESLYMCCLMGVIIPTLQNKDVLMAACKFSRKLLCSLRKNPKSFHNFCRNQDNIHFLINVIIQKVDEPIAIEILHLLILLLKIQHLHNISTSWHLKENFYLLFKINSSPELIAESIYFLNVMLHYEHSFIDMNNGCTVCIFQELLTLSFKQKIRSKCYHCLSLLLKRKYWLASNVGLKHIIEIKCSSPLDLDFADSFCELLRCWLKSLNKINSETYPCIPFEAIRSFISRIPKHVTKLRLTNLMNKLAENKK